MKILPSLLFSISAVFISNYAISDDCEDATKEADRICKQAEKCGSSDSKECIALAEECIKLKIKESRACEY